MSDDLMQKFSGLVDMAEGGLQSKVHEQALRIQAQAKELCPVRRYGSGGGSLRQSIHVSTERQEDLIHSEIYTNSEYAPYVEFGTGPQDKRITTVYPRTLTLYIPSRVG